MGDSLAPTARPLFCGRIRGSHRLARPAPRRWLLRKPGVDTAPGSAPPRRAASSTGHAQHRPALAPVGGKRRTPGRPPATQPSLHGAGGGGSLAVGAASPRTGSAARRGGRAQAGHGERCTGAT